MRISDWSSDVCSSDLLLNIWATWCGPCRAEMPTLDRLQAKLGGPDFEVVALSIDRAGMGAVARFYAEIGVKHPGRYIDVPAKTARNLGAYGLPTQLRIDRDGCAGVRESGRAAWWEGGGQFVKCSV